MSSGTLSFEDYDKKRVEKAEQCRRGLQVLFGGLIDRRNDLANEKKAARNCDRFEEADALAKDIEALESSIITIACAIDLLDGPEFRCFEKIKVGIKPVF